MEDPGFVGIIQNYVAVMEPSLGLFKFDMEIGTVGNKIHDERLGQRISGLVVGKDDDAHARTAGFEQLDRLDVDVVVNQINTLLRHRINPLVSNVGFDSLAIHN